MNTTTRRAPRLAAALLATALLAALPPGAATAQNVLRIGGHATNAPGRIRDLRPDLQSGPLVIPITTGGTLDVRRIIRPNPGFRCLGWVTPRPDLILRVHADVPALRLSVTTTPDPQRPGSSRDTTLVVNGADGRWYCDDDGGGYPNPLVLVPSASLGQYDIWVGSYATGAVVTGELRIESIPFVTTGSANATLGVRELTPETPDPVELQLPSRPVGDIDASAAGSGCAGRVPRQPDLIVRLPSDLPLLLAGFTSATDTTLMVHTPANEWRCNDNASGNNPLVPIRNAAAGTYEVWVGSKAEGTVTGQLQVLRTPVEIGGQVATLGVRELGPGLQPDPVTLDVAAHPAGPISPSLLNAACIGYVTRRPDLIVRLSAPMPFLRAYATSTGDMTLAVHTPGGAWRCADDTYGNNPGVDLRDAAPGQYELWLGAYTADTTVGGQLHLTANENTPP